MLPKCDYNHQLERINDVTNTVLRLSVYCMNNRTYMCVYVFVSASIVLFFFQSEPVGFEVVRVTATDADITNNAITYSIVIIFTHIYTSLMNLFRYTNTSPRY